MLSINIENISFLCKIVLTGKTKLISVEIYWTVGMMTNENRMVIEELQETEKNETEIKVMEVVQEL